MRCRYCGTPNRDGARFCRQCGKELSAPPKRTSLVLFLVACVALAAVAAVFLRGWGGSAAGTVGTVAEGVAQDAEASLEVLLAAGDGESPELAFNDDGSLGFAQGTLSTHSVADDEDALMVLDDLKGLLADIFVGRVRG